MRRVVALDVTGALLCLLLAPIQSAIWNEHPPLFVEALRPVVDGGTVIHAALAAPFGITPYDFWGRMFFVVYLAMLPAAMALWPSSRAGRLGFWLVIGGLTVALLGDVASYWSHGTALSMLWGPGFMIEMLGLLAALVGTIVVAVHQLRQGTRTAAAALMVGALTAVPAAFVVGYVPHGLVLPLTFALAIAAPSAVRVSPSLARSRFARRTRRRPLA